MENELLKELVYYLPELDWQLDEETGKYYSSIEGATIRVGGDESMYYAEIEYQPSKNRGGVEGKFNTCNNYADVLVEQVKMYLEDSRRLSSSLAEMRDPVLEKLTGLGMRWIKKESKYCTSYIAVYKGHVIAVFTYSPGMDDYRATICAVEGYHSRLTGEFRAKWWDKSPRGTIDEVIAGIKRIAHYHRQAGEFYRYIG